MAEITTKANARKIPRVLESALFIAAMLWATGANVIARQAAAGIAGRLRLTYGQDLLASLFLLFLVALGFRALEYVTTQGTHSREVLALPARKTARQEWGSGFAIGWGICLAAVLPVLLLGDFHAVLNRGAGVLPGIVAAVATLTFTALAAEVIYRGYAFRRLVAGVGPAWASVVMSLVFALTLMSDVGPRGFSWAFVDAFLLGVVLAMCSLRTNGLWTGWGLHFGYRVVMAVLLGLPIAGRYDFGSLVDGHVSGPRWLSGGAFGLDTAGWTSIVLLVAMLLVYRVTKDWAWAYTLPEIRAGGYEVVVAPPPAHVAMQATPPPPPLVQILPSTSQTFSAGKELGSKEI